MRLCEIRGFFSFVQVILVQVRIKCALSELVKVLTITHCWPKVLLRENFEPGSSTPSLQLLLQPVVASNLTRLSGELINIKQYYICLKCIYTCDYVFRDILLASSSLRRTLSNPKAPAEC